MEISSNTSKQKRRPEMQRAIDDAIKEGADSSVSITDVTEEILQEAEYNWTKSSDRPEGYYSSMGSYFRRDSHFLLDVSPPDPRILGEDIAILVDNSLAAIANRCGPSTDWVSVAVFHAMPRRFDHWRVLPYITRTYINLAKYDNRYDVMFHDLKTMQDYYCSNGFSSNQVDEEILIYAGQVQSFPSSK